MRRFPHPNPLPHAGEETFVGELSRLSGREFRYPVPRGAREREHQFSEPDDHANQILGLPP